MTFLQRKCHPTFPSAFLNSFAYHKNSELLGELGLLSKASESTKIAQPEIIS